MCGALCLLLLLTDIVIFPAIVSIASSLLFCLLLAYCIIAVWLQFTQWLCLYIDYHCLYVDCYFLYVHVCFKQTLLIIIFVNIANVGVFFVCRMFLFSSVQIRMLYKL